VIYQCIDYSNVLSKEIIDKAIKDINDEIKTNLCEDAPLFQTYPLLFNKSDEHWNILKDTFISSILNTYNIQKLNNIEAWAYVNKVGIEQSQNRWHSHSNSLYSGVMYLQMPKNSKGTSFVDDTNNIVTAPSKEKQWVLFNSNVNHAPPIWDHINTKQDRICLAAIAN
jgi:hypothetical protein